jgi:hypothetical protein
MKKLIYFILILFALTISSIAFASPFLVSDPSSQVIGGGYEIWEITTAYPTGRLAYSGNNEVDGSIKMDLNNVPIGVHNWKIRYSLAVDYSEFTPCTLTVTSLYYKSVVKTFTYYSVTKGWNLKVPK